jgi:hypothetical protein
MGIPLAMDTLKVSPDNVVTIFLLPSLEQIHPQMAGSTTCISAACVITPSEVLSGAPCISCVHWCRFGGFSSLVDLLVLMHRLLFQYTVPNNVYPPTSPFSLNDG